MFYYIHGTASGDLFESIFECHFCICAREISSPVYVQGKYRRLVFSSRTKSNIPFSVDAVKFQSDTLNSSHNSSLSGLTKYCVKVQYWEYCSLITPRETYIDQIAFQCRPNKHMYVDKIIKRKHITHCSIQPVIRHLKGACRYIGCMSIHAVLLNKVTLKQDFVFFVTSSVVWYILCYFFWYITTIWFANSHYGTVL